MQIVLFEPEIPPNTGNIARLCAATNTPLHLIEPLGFSLENRYLKRAGLDYWPNVAMRVWPNWEQLKNTLTSTSRLIMLSAKQRTTTVDATQFSYCPNDLLIFGPETRGLPDTLLAQSPYHLRIPMCPGKVRSLNLSTCAGIVLYLALQSTGIPQGWS
ncbi:MAG: tRNA (cytidine(34)-2'-O)-methyltransferase [Desulfovibrio sp.]|nr:tRNA (cytidine(34)-2'-O)-methyltransferase [Desulfovibrio sp.]